MNRKRYNTPSFVFDNIYFLKENRTDKSLSRQALATKTGVSMEMIAQYERCTSLPGKKNYNKLANFFGWQFWE